MVETTDVDAQLEAHGRERAKVDLCSVRRSGRRLGQIRSDRRRLRSVGRRLVTPSTALRFVKITPSTALRFVRITPSTALRFVRITPSTALRFVRRRERFVIMGRGRHTNVVGVRRRPRRSGEVLGHGRRRLAVLDLEMEAYVPEERRNSQPVTKLVAWTKLAAGDETRSR